MRGGFPSAMSRGGTRLISGCVIVLGPILASSNPARVSATTQGVGEGMDQKQQALVLGGIRLGVGAALVVAPGWAGRIWVGPGADGPGSKVFARAVGARDVALGLRILQSASNDDSPGPWLRAGFVADIADAAATALASRNLSTARKVLMPLIAGGVGALGFAATKAAA